MVWRYFRRLTDFLGSAFDTIGGLISGGFDFVVGSVDKVTGAVGKVLDFLGGLVSSLTSAIGNLIKLIFQPLFDFIGTFFDVLGEVLSYFLELLGNLLKGLFVPSDNFLDSNFKTIQDTLSNKIGIDLSILDSLTKTKEVRGDIFTPIVFTIFGHRQSIDLSFLSYAQPYTRALGTGLVAIFLCWYHYSHVLFLIRKSKPIEGDGHSGQNANNKVGSEK